jgi:hypothetical protein
MALAFFWLAMVLAQALPAQTTAPAGAMAAPFPELEGWRRDGAAESFDADTLYEHIDGAAENFLAYGFVKLAVQNYANEQKQALSAEVYFHGTPENAFGIYGSEKPLQGNYVRIGAEGYEEEGVLNFISGAFYVKLNGFDLGAEGPGVLRALAGGIARALQAGDALPPLLLAFPVAGRVAHSERYIAGNFLGHGFLPAAYTADYESGGRKFRLFVMKAGSEEQARAMLRRYAALDRERPVAEIRPGEFSVRDPYNGTIRLFWRGVYVWGASGDVAAATELIAEIGRRLDGR